VRISLIYRERYSYSLILLATANAITVRFFSETGILSLKPHLNYTGITLSDRQETFTQRISRLGREADPLFNVVECSRIRDNLIISLELGKGET
jgi:hypothetical protein